MEDPFPSSSVRPGSVRVQDPADTKLARSQQPNPYATRRPSSAGNSPIHASTASIPQNLLDAIELASACGRSPRSARASGERPKFVTAFHSPRADQLKIDAFRCLSNGHGPYQGGVLSYEHRKTLKPADLRKLGKPQFQTAIRKARGSEEIGSQKPAELLIASEQEMKLRALSPSQAFSSVREFFGPEFPLAPIAGTESLVRRATVQSTKPQSPLLRPSSPSAVPDSAGRVTSPNSPSFAKVRPESARSPSKLAPSPQFSFSTPLNNGPSNTSGSQAERFRPLSAAVGHSYDQVSNARPEIPKRLILSNLELPQEPASPTTPGGKPLTFLSPSQPASPGAQRLQVPASPGSARDRRSSGGANLPVIPAPNASSPLGLSATPTASERPRRLSNASLAPSVARSDAGSFHPVPRMPPSPGVTPLASPKSPQVPLMSVTLRPVS